MFNWDAKYGWLFGGGCVDAVGPNDADTGIFEGHPYKSLAKEILQNSMDAKDPALPDTVPVEVEFSCLKVPVEEIPGFGRLNDVVGKCSDYYNTGDDGDKVRLWKEKSDQLISQDSVYVLKISDYNTTGLDGVLKLRGTGWSGLVREKYACNKGHGKGGSHGVGKFAPYSFSALRTVLYTTKNLAGETAFQGKTVLTSFEENGQVFHNIGVFGDKNSPSCPPIMDMNDIPVSFRRERVGTDVIVVGFERDENWKEEITVSILQYCFYAIHLGLLTVRITDEDQRIELNKSNLEEYLKEYQKWYEENEHTDDFQFTAPRFYSVLSHSKMQAFPVDFKGMGEITLFLVVDPDIEGRTIYEMRKFGMGIQEDRDWRRINTHFNGLLFATGKGARDDTPTNNIDSFLRKCADPAHNEWGAAYYKGKEKEAKTLLDALHYWIRSCIVAMIPKFDGDSHDAFGLSQFIQNTNNIGDSTEEEDAFSNYEPQSLETREAGESVPKKVSTTVKSNGRGKGNKKPDKREKKGGNPKPDNRRGKKTGNVEQVDIGRVWTPFSDGKYHIWFTPEKDYSQLQLRISVGGDEQGSDTAFIQNAIFAGKQLKTYYGNIDLGDVKKGLPVDVTVVLENGERGGLEVQAYAKQ